MWGVFTNAPRSHLVRLWFLGLVAESFFGQHLSVGQKPFPILGDIDLLTGRIDSSYVGEKAEKPNQLSLAAKPCIRSQHGIEQAESDEMLETKARRGDGEYGRLDEEAG